MFAFAVFHHLPPPILIEILQALGSLLAPNARIHISTWQFINSPRWRARIQPWDKVDIAADDLHPNDYLLDWRRGGLGYRYVHLYDAEALSELAAAVGCKVVDQVHSDGKEGNLALYQSWEFP